MRYAFSRSNIQHHGYEALSASTVEQAITLLEGEDLLFTDLGLRDDLQAGLTAAQENSRAAGSLHHRPSAY